MKLRIWRTAQGLTQAEMGQKLGITQSGVSYIENGHDAPSGPLAAKIIRLTSGQVTLDDLFPPQPEEGAEPSKEAA